MGEYKWIEEIELNQLSNKALMIASRFARVLKQLNGQVLVLQDPMLTRHMIEQVKETDDSELNSLFDSFLLECMAFAETRKRVKHFVPTTSIGKDSALNHGKH